MLQYSDLRLCIPILNGEVVSLGMKNQLGPNQVALM